MPIFRIRRSAPLGALTFLAAAALTTAGCGSNGSADGSALPTQSTGASQAPTSSDPSAGSSADSATGSSDAGGAVLGGTALQTKLSAVSVPSGFTVDSSSRQASGATPTSPGDYEALQSCSDLTNAGADTLTSDHEAAYAEYEIDNSDDLTVNVVAADYYPGDANKQMSEVATLVAKCPSYTAQDINGANVTVKVTSTAKQGLGDQALDIHVNASTGYVSDEFLLVRKGDTIVAMDQDDAADGSMGDLATLAAPYVAALG